MNQTSTQNNNHQQPFFSKVPTYVLACPGENGKLQIAGDGGEGGAAVGCHISPIHALIEAAHNGLRGMHFDVKHAGLIDRKVFRTPDGEGWTADLRLAWPVRKGRIILRTGGGLAVVARRIVHRTNLSSPPPYFEIDQTSLEQIDNLHERAGLFAWRETYRDFASWSPVRRADMIRRALTSIGVTEGNPALCSEAALFDAEFGQWHVVPSADLMI